MTTTLPPTTIAPPSGLMRASEVQRWLKISKATLYAWIASGRLPRGIALSPGVVVFDVAAIANALNLEVR